MFLYRMERFLNIIFRIAIVPAACLAFFSCSTTRVLQDGEYRLQKNKILITNQDEKKFNANDLEPYIKQSPNSYFIFGWNPFLNIYNWSNGKGNGWDRFVRKIGEPPVVYDPDMVESSVSNITDHLTFLGYYNSDVRARIDVRKKRVKVTYNVTLGKQFPIKGITYHVPEGELAADFCGLFLMTDKQAALPYASAYKQDEQEIKRLLVEAGMETSGNFNEPADHLAIYLELLSHLHFSLGEGTVPARRIDSLRQKTLTALWQWLPEFVARCRQYDSFGFYAALSQLLLVLVECDHQNR